jgi:O-antigen ligase
VAGIRYLAAGWSEGFHGKMNASCSLLLLFTIFTIIVCQINSVVILNKIIDIIMPAWFLAILVMSQHRSVFLAGAAGFLLMLIIYMTRIIVLSKMVMASMVLLAVLGITVMSIPQFERKLIRNLSGIINPHADGDASWRMMGWQQQLDRVVSNNQWLFGEGLGGYYQWRYRVTKITASPHNGYVQLVLKFGLFGLCVYVFLAGKFFLVTLKARSKLSPGPMRAYVEMGILNFGAAHAYFLGYGIDLSVLIFVALAMVAVQLQEVSWRGLRTI